MAKRNRKKSPAKKPSKAYKTFERVVERSLNLLSLEKTLDELQESAPKKLLALSDLSRAAVVLAVAAMDAYFTDVFAENLVRYLKTKGARSQLITLLSEAGLDTTVALELLAMERPYRRVRRLIETHNERRTTQRTDAIDKLFLAYGIKGFCQRAEGIAKRKNLMASVHKLVTRRNDIAHDGDINSHGTLQPVNREQIRRKVRDVVTLVAASEELLAKALP